MKRWHKWVVCAVGIVLFLASGIRATPIGERAIVVGFAVDMVDEDMLQVTAQILVATGESGSSTNGSAIAVAQDSTISGALNEISKQTSMQISLSHCNIVILGQSVLEGKAYAILDYLTRNAYLSENALLATADNGYDILNTNVAYGDISSFYAQQAISTYGEFYDITNRTIKEYISSYYTYNGANWITKIEKVSTQTPDTAEEDEDESFMFELGNTAIILKEDYQFTVDETYTAALNLVLGEVDKGTLRLVGDNSESMDLFIISKNQEVTGDVAAKEVEITVNIVCILKEIISDEGTVSLNKRELSATEEERLISQISQSITDLYDTAAAYGVDIYDVYAIMNRADHTMWVNLVEEYGSNYMNEISISTNINISYE